LMMYVWEKRELLVEDLSLKSFLFTSVRNRALNSITRSHITRQVYEEYQSQQLKSLPALDSCYGTELFNTYMEALHSLPKELQRVYVMSRYKQLTHKEIADKLEVSVQTVNYRIGKALQFFRIRLKDFCLE
jgi:RNA polymerase sigma factor, sigma-70 family